MTGTTQKTTTQPRRRAILAGTAAALAAGALAALPKAASAAPGSDAELIAACDRFTALEYEKRRIFAATPASREAEIAAEPAIDKICAEQDDLLDQITDMQAKTLDGIRARVRMVFAADCPCFADYGDQDDQMIGALMHDLNSILGIGAVPGREKAL